MLIEGELVRHIIVKFRAIRPALAPVLLLKYPSVCVKGLRFTRSTELASCRQLDKGQIQEISSKDEITTSGEAFVEI